MTVSSVGSAASASTSTTSSLNSQLDAFRQANFLQIMMAEITNQDPLNPTDTSKMVESMQQLQQLANSTYQKFRQDIGWSQSLVGQNVTITQVGATAAQKQAYTNSGLNVDVGYGTVDGKVDGFKVVNSTVWLSVNGHDYPADNVQQVHSDTYDTGKLLDTANRMLGMSVQYVDATGATTQGTVTSVGYDDAGKIMLGVGNSYVYPDSITAITVPGSTG